jgi:hypothetical protein
MKKMLTISSTLAIGVATVTPTVVACDAKPNIGQDALSRIVAENAPSWIANIPDDIKYPTSDELKSNEVLLAQWFDAKVKPYLYLEMRYAMDEPENNIAITLMNETELDLNYWSVAPIIKVTPVANSGNSYYDSGEFNWPSQSSNVVPHIWINSHNEMFQTWCDIMSKFKNGYDIHDDANVEATKKLQKLVWATINVSDYIISNQYDLIHIREVKQLKGMILKVACKFRHKDGNTNFNILLKLSKSSAPVNVPANDEVVSSLERR